MQRLEAAASIYDEAEMDAAANALVEIGRPAVSRLMKAAVHDDRNVRWQAIVALGRIGSPAADSATPILAAALTHDSDPDVRSGAAEALGRLRIRSADVLAALQRGIHDAHGKVRADAHWALAQINPHPAAIPALATLLADKDWMIAETAGRHLASLGPGALPALLFTLDADGPGRASAVRAMALMSREILGPALDPLLHGLDDKDPVVAAACARTLGHMDQIALPSLRHYLTAPTPTNPAGALRALGACESASRDCMPVVLRYLQGAQRLAAIECLEAMGSAARPAAGSLAGLLLAREADTRAAAASALGHTGGITAESATLLGRLADSDPADHVRAAARQALGGYAKRGG